MKLIDPRPVVTMELPSYPGSEVKFRKGLTVGQQMQLGEKFPGYTNAESPEAIKAGIEMIIMSIVDWNFTDDNDVKLEINQENVYKLGMEDISKMLSVFTEEKKK